MRTAGSTAWLASIVVSCFIPSEARAGVRTDARAVHAGLTTYRLTRAISRFPSSAADTSVRAGTHTVLAPIGAARSTNILRFSFLMAEITFAPSGSCTRTIDTRWTALRLTSFIQCGVGLRHLPARITDTRLWTDTNAMRTSITAMGHTYILARLHVTGKTFTSVWSDTSAIYTRLGTFGLT